MNIVPNRVVFAIG
jgi:hypothetical protein